MAQLTLKTELEGKIKTVTISYNGNNYDKVQDAIQKGWPEHPRLFIGSSLGKIESNEEWKKALNDALKKKQDYVYLTLSPNGPVTSSSASKPPQTTTTSTPTSKTTSTPPPTTTSTQTSTTTSTQTSTTTSTPQKNTSSSGASITHAPEVTKQGPPPEPKGELLTAFTLAADKSKGEKPSFDAVPEGQAFVFSILPGIYETKVSIYLAQNTIVYRCEYQKSATLHNTFQQTFELPETPKEDNIRIIPGKPAPKVSVSFD